MQKYYLEKADAKRILSFAVTLAERTVKDFDKMNEVGRNSAVGKLFNLAPGSLDNALRRKNDSIHFLSIKSLNTLKEKVNQFFSFAPAAALRDLRGFTQDSFESLFKKIQSQDANLIVPVKNKEKDKSNPLYGTYNVYYTENPEEGVLKVDTLEFSKFQDNRILLIYNHVTADGVNVSLEGNGIVDYEGNVLIINARKLTQYSPLDNSEQTIILEPNYFVFNIPDKKITTIDAMTGIWTGARLRDTGSLSRMILLTRQYQNVEDSKIALHEIEDFFEKYKFECCVKPPSTVQISTKYHFQKALKYAEVDRQLSKLKNLENSSKMTRKELIKARSNLKKHIANKR